MATAPTLPPSSTASSGAAATQQHSVQSIGASFVSQYYGTLVKDTSKLHKYYKSESRLSFIVSPDKKFAAQGQDAIKTCFSDLKLSECKMVLSEVECQESLHGSVLIVVDGSLSVQGAPMQRFTQTFLLAAQTIGYYVLNDIFRYITPDQSAPHAEEADIAAQVASETDTPAEPASPVDEAFLKKMAATPVEGSDGSEVDSTAATAGTMSGAASVKSEEFESEPEEAKKQQQQQQPPVEQQIKHPLAPAPQSQPASQRPQRERRDRKGKPEGMHPSAASEKTAPTPTSQEVPQPRQAWNVSPSSQAQNTTSTENPTPKESNRRRVDRNADKPRAPAHPPSSYAAAVGNTFSDKNAHGEGEAVKQERPEPRKQTGTSSGSEQGRQSNGWSVSEPPRRNRSFEDTKHQLFVGNLSSDTTQTDLHTLFDPCGKIINIILKTYKGFALINFDTAAAVDAALKLTDLSLHGKPLKVNFNKSQERGSRMTGGHGDTKRDGSERRFDRYDGRFQKREGSFHARDRNIRRDEVTAPSENNDSPTERRSGGPGYRVGPRHPKFGGKDVGRGFTRPSSNPAPPTQQPPPPPQQQQQPQQQKSAPEATPAAQ